MSAPIPPPIIFMPMTGGEAQAIGGLIGFAIGGLLWLIYWFRRSVSIARWRQCPRAWMQAKRHRCDKRGSIYTLWDDWEVTPQICSLECSGCRKVLWHR